MDRKAFGETSSRWTVVTKGDPRCRYLADRHYSRQKPGSPQFTRPGFNLVLHFSDDCGHAVFVWWRPKWESGIPGTERKDGLRCIECTIFRNESSARSSDLIREAVTEAERWEHCLDVDLPDGAISGVNAKATEARRSRRSLPGECFRRAGWVEFGHRPGVADVWLRCSDFRPPFISIHDHKPTADPDVSGESDGQLIFSSEGFSG